MAYRKVKVAESARNMKNAWTQLKLGSVEDFDVKLAIYQGDYNLHVHENHDEFIYVLNGEIKIKIKDEIVILKSGDGLFIQKGTRHKPFCENRAEVLLFERNTILNDYKLLDEGA